MAIDSNELAGLSAAERAALEEDDELGTLDEPAQTDDGDDDDNAPTPGPSPAEGEDDEPGAVEGADGENAGELPPGSQAFNVPTGDLQAISEQLTSLRSAVDELESAYDSGDSELTFAEYKAKLRELNDAILDLNAERAEVQAVQRMNQAYQQQWWTNEIRSFKREAAREGVDYDADPKLAAEWDKAVRYLGNDPDNADKDASWFLREGHEMVKARFRIGGQAPQSSASKLSKVDEALANRRQRAGDPPRTLANLPQAGVEQEGQGEFSHLEKLSGLDLEKALARMSPDQQERYLTA